MEPVLTIGELNQTDLHEELKRVYCDRGGETEVEVDGFVVDVRLPNEIVEIQTRSVGKLKRKLLRLSANHRVRLVHPIARSKYIERIDGDGGTLSRRRSPKRGRVEDAFREISSIADFLPNPNITVEIVLVDVTELRRDDGRGSWRRKGVSIVGRRLDGIVKRYALRLAKDYLRFLPGNLPESFTNRDVVAAAGLTYRVAQSMTSSLRKMGLISITDKRGRELLYRRGMR
ncbi:MAG: hypothetical protein KAU31_04745 [Spirochaetaceae bacterium]|nr:hypothetical protein [Spirochaetaceae bacterium]